jgi:hypothetical protein
MREAEASLPQTPAVFGTTFVVTASRFVELGHLSESSKWILSGHLKTQLVSLMPRPPFPASSFGRGHLSRFFSSCGWE